MTGYWDELIEKAKQFGEQRNVEQAMDVLLAYADDEDALVLPEEAEDTYSPPEGVRSAARRALQLIADGKAGGGFTDVGRARAKQLAAGTAVSLATIRRMHSFFSRHAGDKKNGWSDAGKETPGYVAWLAWGGDAGAAWAKGIVGKNEKAAEGTTVVFNIDGVHLPAIKEAARLVVNATPDTSTTQPVVLQVAGKTLLAAPVENVGRADNPHYLWIEGALVGSEEPNRNGALWSTADLEFGQPSVLNGPLNWLHEARSVVGTIVGAQMVYPQEKADDGGRKFPYIRTQSAMWTWLYPQEAQLVEQASEWGKVWQSMECISETVTCAGESGCGESVGYMDMVKGAGCDHIRERSSVRHFNNPTFLGSALILPPARPGWAHADAVVMKQAEQAAESTFEAANGMSPEEWQNLMAAVIASA
jgi:hypothetical protein